VTSTQSAEIIKHASNAFLAMKISFINAVANLAEAVDADIEDISAGIGLDSRIGPKFLRAGLGYGGSCFPKDVAAFHWVAQERGVDFQLLEEVRKINETQKKSSSTRCARHCGRCAASGWRRWAWPSRARRTTFASRPPSHDSNAAADSGAIVTAYDPAAMERAKEVLPPAKKLHYAERSLQGGEGRRRGADSDRLEGVCHRWTWRG
jgi:UDPglucose 6-dehydrogenase